MKRDILIVDDEPAVLGFLKTLLNNYSEHFNVHTAMSGEAALRIMETHRISLLTTDIRMPGMDGFELLRQAREKNPDTRFIVMTAHGSDELFKKSREHGAIEFLKKPSHHIRTSCPFCRLGPITYFSRLLIFLLCLHVIGIFEPYRMPSWEIHPQSRVVRAT